MQKQKEGIFPVKRILTLVLASWSLWSASADEGGTGGETLILWMLDDPVIQEVNGGGSVRLGALEGRGEAAGLGVNAVRVSATQSSGSVVYLDLMSDDGLQGYIELPGIKKVGGEWVETWKAGPTYADIAGYSFDASVSFAIELGNWSDDGTWLILAVSQSSTLEELRSKEYVFSSATDMQGHLPWTGGAYVVPEPSSGLLLLVGAGLLSLRRRRRAV